MSGKLALFGGLPVRVEPFPAYENFGEAEIEAANRVLRSGVLSRFLGAWHEDFMGGEEVRALEAEWAALYDVDHAITVNSNTSGLQACMGAIGLEPGDEVICTPYSMCASASSPLVFNAIPIFADIDPRTYCLSAATIAAKITPRTKAILVVHIFGQVADMDPIMWLASEHGLKVIEDCAQAPLGNYKGRPVGTIGDAGVFSLNYHKHIHTGEGGVVVTNDAGLAERVALIRNHAEAVVGPKGVEDLTNMIGFNFRLGEIEAAIGREQIKRAQGLIETRLKNVAYLEERLSGLQGLTMPYVTPGSSHAYYLHVMDYDAATTGVSRQKVLDALKAELPLTQRRESEGVLMGAGYVRPLYLLPMFQKQICYGTQQFPFKGAHYDGSPDYSAGSCPQAEAAHFERVITHEMMRPGMSETDLDAVVAAFHKVWDNLDDLRAP